MTKSKNINLHIKINLRSCCEYPNYPEWKAKKTFFYEGKILHQHEMYTSWKTNTVNMKKITVIKCGNVEWWGF